MLTFHFDASGFTKAIKDLTALEGTLNAKADELVRRLAEIGVEVADREYHLAPYAGENDVRVFYDQENGKGTATIRATGNAVLFIEFGTGILNPENWRAREALIDSEGVVLHGQYGDHKGDSVFGWTYKGDMPANPPTGTGPSYKSGNGYIHTYGEGPHPAMYHARKEIIEKVQEIAKEVFSND